MGESIIVTLDDRDRTDLQNQDFDEDFEPQAEVEERTLDTAVSSLSKLWKDTPLTSQCHIPLRTVDNFQGEEANIILHGLS